MAYHRLSLPAGLPLDLEKLLRDQLETQLADVHSMMRLPIKDDPGLQAGCNFTIAQVLLSVVSGVSVTLYEPSKLNMQGVSGPLFKGVLEKHYPWDEERHLPGAQVDADGAKQLYQLFRNPLAHALGVIVSPSMTEAWPDRTVVAPAGTATNSESTANARMIVRPTARTG
jgi:hypothetical protein